MLHFIPRTALIAAIVTFAGCAVPTAQEESDVADDIASPSESPDESTATATDADGEDRGDEQGTTDTSEEGTQDASDGTVGSASETDSTTDTSLSSDSTTDSTTDALINSDTTTDSTTDTSTSSDTETETSGATTTATVTVTEVATSTATGSETNGATDTATGSATGTATNSTTATTTATDTATSTTTATSTGSDSATDTDTATNNDCGPIEFLTTAVDIGENLPAAYEPSGLDYHEARKRLVVVSDEGVVSLMDDAGENVTSWSLSYYDLEGVAVVDDGDLIYLGVENPDSILEFNLNSGRVTREFPLTTWMTGASNAGLEALAFVPDDNSSEGGYFYAGHQGEGTIYVFELPIRSSTSSTAVTFIESFTPIDGRIDLAALDYDAVEDVLYAVYDGANKLTSLTLDGEVLTEIHLPQSAQEGLTRNDACDVFIAQDTGAHIWWYKAP